MSTPPHVASTAYGLHEHRLHQLDLSGASRTELRNTDAFVGCLGDTWKNPVPPQ